MVGSADWNNHLEVKLAQWTRNLTVGYDSVTDADVRRAAGSVIPAGYEDWNAVGLAWAKAFLRRQTAFDSFAGNPTLAEDTKLLDMTLKAHSTGTDDQKLVYSFQYAYRPMWGLDVAKAYYAASGRPYALGTGDLAGYIICTYPAVTISRTDYGAWALDTDLSDTASVPTGDGWVAA